MKTSDSYTLTLIFFIASILLLASACIPQPNPQQGTPTTNSIRITPNLTDTPAITPSATFAPITREPACLEAPLTRLIIQERARVTDNGEKLNLRENPGTDQDIVTRIDPGQIFVVLDGPTCLESYAWFQVNYQGSIGWIAEGDEEQYYTEPYLPG